MIHYAVRLKNGTYLDRDGEMSHTELNCYCLFQTEQFAKDVCTARKRQFSIEMVDVEIKPINELNVLLKEEQKKCSRLEGLGEIKPEDDCELQPYYGGEEFAIRIYVNHSLEMTLAESASERIKEWCKEKGLFKEALERYIKSNMTQIETIRHLNNRAKKRLKRV